MLAPFCVFGGVPKRRREMNPKSLDFGILFGSLGLPLGSLFHQKSSMISMKKCITFLIDFESLFSSILTPCWSTFCIKTRPWDGEGDFIKMSVSPARELHFRGSGIPKSIQMASKKGSKKACIFVTKKTYLFDSNRLPK